MNAPTPPGGTVTRVKASSDGEFPAREASGPDPDASAVPRWTAPAMAQVFRLGATCDTPGKSITVRVYWLDSQDQPHSSTVVTFASGAADWGGVLSVGIAAGADVCWPLGGAKAVAIKVDAVSGGTWTIRGAMA